MAVYVDWDKSVTPGKCGKRCASHSSSLITGARSPLLSGGSKADISDSFMDELNENALPSGCIQDGYYCIDVKFRPGSQYLCSNCCCGKHVEKVIRGNTMHFCAKRAEMHANATVVV
jgi:hypothetical protein